MFIVTSERFPAHPLRGTFELASSTFAVDASRRPAEWFWPDQRVRFEFLGEVGGDWPGREEYRVTLSSRVGPGCPSDDSDRPCGFAAALDARRLSTRAEVARYAQFIPYGLEPGGFVYELTSADAHVSYRLYFQDWDTLISHTAALTRGDAMVAVEQVLKRVQER